MEEKIRKILKDIQPLYDFEDGINFIEAGYLDSFAVVALVGALEEEFQTRISPLEILPENFESVAAIGALVNKSING